MLIRIRYNHLTYKQDIVMADLPHRTPFCGLRHLPARLSADDSAPRGCYFRFPEEGD
jgi:hypothetical protein